MITPDDETDAKGDEVVFVRRWNQLVRALIVEPSVKLVARTAVDYGVYDGTRIFPGNQRLAREAGLSTESVRHAWKVLRAAGMATRDYPSQWNGKIRTADEYTLVIPGDWRCLPVLGPKSGRFTCQQCGKVFNPRPGTVPRKDGTIGFVLAGMIFCAPGRRGKHAGESCFRDWAAKRKGREVTWEMFRQARNDDWPR